MTSPVIESVGASAYVVPTDRPEGDGTFAWDATTLVLVQVRAAGKTGTGWTYGSTACATVVEHDLAPVLLGRDALAPRGSWVAMVRSLRNTGRPGVAGMALSAVDLALWDLAARLLDQPLPRLLGSVRDEVPVYGSGGFTTYDEKRLVEQVGGWVHEDGIPRVKIKIGESDGTCEERDLQRIGQARAAIGPAAELYVDANGGYSVGQATRMAARFAEHDVRWFEEPVSSDDLDGLREVRGECAPDVAAGEYGFDLVYFQRMCAARSVDCLQVDITRCGGPTELLRIAAVAAAHGLEVSGHCAPHAHVATLAAVPNLRHLEWFHDHVRIEAMLFEGAASPVGGALPVQGDATGLGLTWRAGAAEEFRVR